MFPKFEYKGSLGKERIKFNIGDMVETDITDVAYYNGSYKGYYYFTCLRNNVGDFVPIDGEPKGFRVKEDEAETYRLLMTNEEYNERSVL